MSAFYPFRGVAQSGHCLLFLPFFLYDGFPKGWCLAAKKIILAGQKIQFIQQLFWRICIISGQHQKRSPLFVTRVRQNDFSNSGNGLRLGGWWIAGTVIVSEEKQMELASCLSDNVWLHWSLSDPDRQREREAELQPFLLRHSPDLYHESTLLINGDNDNKDMTTKITTTI